MSSLSSDVPQKNGWWPEAERAVRKYPLEESYIMNAKSPCVSREVSLLGKHRHQNIIGCDGYHAGPHYLAHSILVRRSCKTLTRE